ncbi:MAG: hypothetical protein HC828_00440, partial [Blastochloris sp.]|nr:hypothetical protein [Blastochloris sp.]
MAEASTWAEAEFGAANLGDVRRTQRPAMVEAFYGRLLQHEATAEISIAVESKPFTRRKSRLDGCANEPGGPDYAAHPPLRGTKLIVVPRCSRFIGPHQPIAHGEQRRLRTVNNIELAQDLPHICLDGVLGQVESQADLLVAAPTCHQPQHRQLPLRQLGEGILRRRDALHKAPGDLGVELGFASGRPADRRH